MIKAVIFDMDGVLIDTEYLSDIYYLEVFSKIGLSPTIEEFELLRGTNSKSFWAYFMEKYNVEEPTEEFKNKARLGFVAFLKAKKVEAMPGVKELIEKLHEKNFLIGLASSASKIRVKEQLKLIKLSKYFKKMVTGEEVIHGKPHPEVYLKIAKKLSIDPKYCVAIEDAKHGVESAKKAGMKVVGFKGSTNHKQDISLADIIVESMTQIDVSLLNNL